MSTAATPLASSSVSAPEDGALAHDVFRLPGPQHPFTADREADVWRVDLKDPGLACPRIISVDEAARAEKFHFDRDRRRFLAGREALRRVLAAYLEAEPWEIVFSIGRFGKPSIKYPETSLRFNISHSEEMLVIAVGQETELGVDIEAIREQIPFEMLAEHYLDPEEAWRIRTAPPLERPRLFYIAWTKVEARLKASGHGFSCVSGGRWSGHISSFTPGSGFAGALASEGVLDTIRFWSWRNCV